MLRSLAVVVVVAALGLSPTVLASGSPVLGEKGATGPYGKGWGASRPTEIFNGGDPSGLVTKIRWSTWGGSVASGTGLNAIFKPQGGYYRQLVVILLRAYDLGHCTANGPLAYRKLSAREPSRPGGPDGKWFAWSGDTTIC